MPKNGFLKRISIKILYFLGVVLLLIITGEITARLMGFRPWNFEVQSLKVEPEGRFFQDDDLLGYKGKAGNFKLILKDSLHFEVNHNNEGWRITSIDSSINEARPEIWVFGCSFTHGYGVNDSETYPWLLQTQFPQYKVMNYGMDGYGTLQNWLLLKSLLDAGKRPALVILAYGAFHDQRNTANRYWHKALHGQQIAESMRYPFLRLTDKDSLQLHYGKIEYHPLPFQKQLALLALIEENWNQNEDAGLRSKFVTELLIERMVNASHNAGSKFILTGIYQHPDTEKMLKIFQLSNVQTVDISQDLSQLKLRILPGNSHPNGIAHRLMADKLIQYLQNNLQALETQDQN